MGYDNLWVYLRKMDKFKIQNSKFKILFLFTLFFCFYAFADVDTSAPAVNMIQKNITAEKEKTEKQIEKQKKEVDQLISAHLFEKASLQIEEIRKLTSKLGSSKYVAEQLQSVEKLEKKMYREWSVYLENKAKSSSLNKEWDDSLNYAQESIKKLETKDISSPLTVVKNREIIEKAEHGLATQKFDDVTSMETLIPDYGQEKTDIEKFFVLAETYSKSKEYEKARDMLEKILILEPYNYKAMYELKQMYQKVAATGRKRKYMQMKERLAQTEWGYTPPIKTQIPKKDIIPITETKDSSLSIEKKLESIIIPEVAFNEASIKDVVKHLIEISELYDSEDNAGINISLRMDQELQDSKKLPNDFVLKNISLGHLLECICEILNLNMKIETHSVIISDKDMNTMILKYIPLKSDIINSIADVNDFEIKEDADIESIEELSDDSSELTPVEITDEIIKIFFVERGVPFPEGSTIAWDMVSGTLITKNTPGNIKILTDLLHDIDINMPQVLIEVKFIELTYDKNKGLAFNWRINLEGTNWGMNQISQGSGEGDIAGNDFMNRTGDLLNLFEFSQNPINIGNAAGALDFFVYAIEQTSMGETLSAPKIITKSGSTALFEMVEKNYYATSWTVTDPEVVYETVQITPPTPDFEEMKMGVVLQVTPTVAPNNKTVFLDVYPVIKQFQRYDAEFKYSVTNINSSTETDTSNLVPFVNRDLLMPIILNRDIKSKLKINDGETVVLGGMLRDKTTKVMDKYPILGDFPVVGRFFRSEYEVVEQSNLLMFVTVKLINPDGTLLHKPKPNGLFEFRNT